MDKGLLNIIAETTKMADDLLVGLKRGTIQEQEGLVALSHCRNTLSEAYDVRLELGQKNGFSQSVMDNIESRKNFVMRNLDSAINDYLQSKEQYNEMAPKI